MLIDVPGPLHEHARRRVDNPPEAADAATIAVVRDGQRGLEAFLMRRQASMVFGGMSVFPGGRVQESDAEEIELVGPPVSWFAERFGCELDRARALLVAAVRETFEEVGVLLAGPDDTKVVDDLSGLSEYRAALEAKELSFASFLRGQNLVLRADLVGPWAHWITPAFEPRRYDTRFFVAALPAGQRVAQVNDEADLSGWEPLGDVLRRHRAGEVLMLPPTVRTCEQLAGLRSGDVVESAALREIRPILPALVHVEGKMYLETGEEANDG